MTIDEEVERHEREIHRCEVRTVVRMSKRDREKHLAGVVGKRSKAASDKLIRDVDMVLRRMAIRR